MMGVFVCPTGLVMRREEREGQPCDQPVRLPFSRIRSAPRGLLRLDAARLPGTRTADNHSGHSTCPHGWTSSFPDLSCRRLFAQVKVGGVKLSSLSKPVPIQ